MNAYAVVLTIPGKCGREIARLRRRYSKFMDYSIEPHITLAPVFRASSASQLSAPLAEVACQASPFSLKLTVVRYFEGQNNVAYVAMEDPGPIFALNALIARALDGLAATTGMAGLTVGGQPLLFDRSTYIPHVTIAENIPKEELAAIKSELAPLQMEQTVKIRSFCLFTAEADAKPQMWGQLSVYPLGRPPG